MGVLLNLLLLINAMIVLLTVIALAVFIFWYILELDIPGVWKFGLVFVEMLAVSQIFIRRYKLPSELGLVLIKSKRGIQIIEDLTRHKHIFMFLSDTGNAIAYGLLSTVMIQKRRSAPSIVLGLLLLGFISVVVAPFALSFLFKTLDIGAVDKSEIVSLGEGQEYLYGLLMLGVLIIGGLFLFILLGIIFYGGVVLNALIQSLVFGTDAIAQTSPGGTFLLPGVNLPFFEGLIALIIVMVVHEGAHAILTRIGKIPLLSSGVVLFGIIPVGAFVEPDENKLMKADDVRQTRVLVAGSTSNLMTSCIFFVLFVALASAMDATAIQNDALTFIKTTFGLSFALNFIVGAVNLLPLPLFDGYRLIDVNVKNKHIVKALMYVTLAFFVLNFLPWFFRA